MSTTISTAPEDFKTFLRILGETEDIPGLARMDRGGAIHFHKDGDPEPSDEFGEVTELPLGLGWYRGICDRVPYPELLLTPKGWRILTEAEPSHHSVSAH